MKKEQSDSPPKVVWTPRERWLLTKARWLKGHNEKLKSLRNMWAWQRIVLVVGIPVVFVAIYLLGPDDMSLVSRAIVALIFAVLIFVPLLIPNLLIVLTTGFDGFRSKNRRDS
ncbi:MAG: hypothetical protein GC155_12575 [Alphaproteobacteria bacterium]|nr:hypothetical protein [Alphaproteobacteria bacterium]